MKSKRSLLFFAITLCSLMAYSASPTGTLPVVYLTTNDGQSICDKENYKGGTVYIDPLSTGYEALGSAQTPVTAQLRGRGNWTWNGFDKKPYKIKFDAKQKVLGMPSNKHWCLMAHADDNLGFLKNYIGYVLSEQIGLKWTPRTVPVELVINGSYEGLYFLTEHVRVGSQRVNITEQEDLSTEDVTGGWLVEIDNYWEEGNVEFYEGNGQHMMVTMKSPEILSQTQRDYITAQLHGLNDAIYGSSAEQLWGMLDVDEAAKYYLVQEIMEDCESYHGSCYLYKDRDINGQQAKWFFGPVWDFGNAYNRHRELWIYEAPSFAQYWIGQIAQWPEFQVKVKEYWYIYYHSLINDTRSQITSFSNLISSAAVQDANKWRGTQNYCDNSNLTNRKNDFLDKFNWRINWLYSQLGEGIRPATWDNECVESPALNIESKKILRDGQIIIQRGAKFYTLQGQEIRSYQ